MKEHKLILINGIFPLKEFKVFIWFLFLYYLFLFLLILLFKPLNCNVKNRTKDGNLKKRI